MDNMNVKVVVHSRLSARDILNESLWKDNYCYFNGGKRNNGIYFYSYYNAKIPYYVGMCAAKSYNIIGRVWDELNDYREGRYYLPKETEKLSTLECFTRESSAQTFFIPGYYDKDDKAFQDTLNKMLDNTTVLFSYLETDPQVDASMMKKIVYNIEAYFQNNIVTAKRLHPKWIGDHGKGYSLEKQYNYIVEIIYENSNIMNALDEKILLGK